MDAEFFRKVLSQDLAARQKRNPRYSLRSYARALKIDAGQISRILSGKRLPSTKLALQLAASLSLSPGEGRVFLKSVLAAKEALSLDQSIVRPVPAAQARELDLVAFEVIQQPYHYAILELTFAEGFRSDTAWIAKRLGLTRAQAREAIARLCKLGLLVRVDGQLRKANAQLTTKNKHLTTRALQNRFERTLTQARQAMREEPIERRSLSTMTMCIDPAKLPFAKQMIGEFVDAICALLESGARKEVYELAIALFPVEKNKSNRVSTLRKV